MKKKRSYRIEYDTYQGRPEQIKRRAKRNAARAKMVKAGKAHKGDNRDTAHKNNSPFDNSMSNLEMQSEHKNRREPRLRGRKKRK